MGRKVKLVLILLVLGALSVILCGTQTEQTYAKEEHTEEPVEPEKPEEPKIPIEKYKVENTPPDGNNGYYRSMPKVNITHISKRGITNYKFVDTDGIVTEGMLNEPNSLIEIPGELYREGNNQLTLWMEDEDGNLVSDTELVREFYVDTKPPKFELSGPNGLDSWYQKEMRLKVLSSDGDRGSNIESIGCYYGNQAVGISENAQAAFLIGFESQQGNGIAVKVVVTDRAGNRSERIQKLYIDHAPPTLSIQGIENYMITSQPVDLHFVAEEDNSMQEVSATVVWENVDGQSVVLPRESWERSTLQYSLIQRLQEDGLYKISASVSDKAGYRKEQNLQVIIDTKNPIIRFVDQVNQKFLREFQWDYPVEEMILDYSSYVYEIKVDGKSYQMGEKLKTEGTHQLKVKAVDMAGNEATATAAFVIDRTPPAIHFGDVENNQAYEEEKNVRITLKNQEDVIEEICINGQQQKINKRSKVYDYALKECKDYLITVKAIDKAGNKEQSQVGFRVEKKKTFLERMIHPMGKRFQIKQGDSGTPKKFEETKMPAVTLFLATGMAGVVLIIVILFVIRKRIQQKNSP